jgi:hypothetical protein
MISDRAEDDGFHRCEGMGVRAFPVAPASTQPVSAIPPAHGGPTLPRLACRVFRTLWSVQPCLNVTHGPPFSNRSGVDTRSMISAEAAGRLSAAMRCLSKRSRALTRSNCRCAFSASLPAISSRVAANCRVSASARTSAAPPFSANTSERSRSNRDAKPSVTSRS